MTSLTPRAAERWEVTVSSGDVRRHQSIVRFLLPDEVENPVLRDADGNPVPLQIDGGNAIFVLTQLNAGDKATYRLRSRRAPRRLDNHVVADSQDGKLRIVSFGKPVIQYHVSKSQTPAGYDPIYRRAGYIHPVWSPSGLEVTDDYPSDHKHHHGIWFPWTKTEFEGRHPDFWNMGGGTGTVEIVGLDGYWSGPVTAGFKTRHRFVDLSATPPKDALNETWTVQVYGVRPEGMPYAMFDLESIQTCATDSPLKLPEYRYGGLGVRGRGGWNGEEHTYFMTANGETDRIKGHATRAKWCHMGGKLEGQLTGIAILCHPNNFRAPQPMRIHPSEPFFNFAPSQAGDWEIKPGKPYVSHYRFIVFDGPPNKETLDHLWEDYANPCRVEVKIAD